MLSTFIDFVDKLLQRLYEERTTHTPKKQQEEEPSFFDQGITVRPSTQNKERIFFEACGHTGPRQARLMVHGKLFSLKEIPTDWSTYNSLCPNCWAEHYKKHAIQCAFCGAGIVPGDPVAVYHKESLGIHQEVAVTEDSGVIGCLNPTCSPYPDAFSGYWTTIGFRRCFNRGVHRGRLAEVR
jgi:hypothetical protein